MFAFHGCRVTKPYGDSYPYDFLVEIDTTAWRVQVKSCIKISRNGGYQFTTRRTGGARSYRKSEIDFLACYIVQTKTWYIIPRRPWVTAPAFTCSVPSDETPACSPNTSKPGTYSNNVAPAASASKPPPQPISPTRTSAPRTPLTETAPSSPPQWISSLWRASISKDAPADESGVDGAADADARAKSAVARVAAADARSAEASEGRGLSA